MLLQENPDLTFDDLELQLPYDSLPVPNTPPHLGSHAFDLVAVEDRILFAAFGVLLARYSGQTSTPLKALRLTADGKSISNLRSVLNTSSESSLRKILETGGETLGVSRDFKGRHAAVTWLEGDLNQLAQAALSSCNVDLNLVLARHATGFKATFFYNVSLLKLTSVVRFAGHLSTLLDGLTDNIDVPISKLPLLPATERKWIELVCTGPDELPPRALTHESFEYHALQTPTAPALKFRDQICSYSELNSRANRLARALSSRGVGSESRVMVCVEPSMDIAVVLLAILKVGAAYVPLDSSYPSARIKTLMDDTAPALVVARDYLIERLALDRSLAFSLDDHENFAGDFSPQNLGRSIRRESTAYIFYTSGTTGKPKGIMATFANLAHYIESARDRYQSSSADVIPAVARFSFSISLFELMLPLASGGTLLLLERDHVLDLGRLAMTLREVTFFHMGPSLLKNLIAHIKKNQREFSAFDRVRHASSGGDMVPPEVLESLKLIFSKAEVFVIYGCSEISCMGCTYPVPRDRTVTKTYVGRPFQNGAVRVLDGAMNLVPIGVVGEICFTGAGIVQGYLERPELTAEKFVDLDGRRFYRTGDRGRLSEDGWLEILGRSDFQIQLRGMRIELGEVDHHLRRAPCVKDAVSIARENSRGEKILVAYVVLDSPGPIDRKPAIRQYLRENLPDYMVPSIFVVLEKLPLNHNMKLDRNALPAPAPDDRRIGDRDASPMHRAPETSTQRKLASIWERILNLDFVRLDDHFFDLGGDSLSAMELIDEVEQALGVTLDGMDVLRESLAVQALICDRRLGKANAVSLVPVISVMPTEAVKLLHFGQNQSLYGVLHGDLSGMSKRAALICPPLGQESVRTHFVLKRLGERLAANGVPTLRFDFFGQGDSLGENASASVSRWKEDIMEACDELCRRTRAEKITLIGVRLGATLATHVLERRDIERAVLWAPVVDGGSYVAELEQAQKRYLRNVRNRRRWKPPVRIADGAELVGSTYSSALLNQLRALTLQTEFHSKLPSIRHFESSSSKDSDPVWTDLSRIDQILPDAGISNQLLKLVIES